MVTNENKNAFKIHKTLIDTGNEVIQLSIEHKIRNLRDIFDRGFIICFHIYRRSLHSKTQQSVDDRTKSLKCIMWLKFAISC
jgi:phosphosulfolactate synthase (CoM biosynthesis protein A)